MLKVILISFYIVISLMILPLSDSENTHIKIDQQLTELQKVPDSIGKKLILMQEHVMSGCGFVIHKVI